MMLRWWRCHWDAVKWGSRPTCRPQKQETHASLPATHTARWFYRWVCDYKCVLLNVRVGMWGVTICHSGTISHMRVCVFGRDCEGHLCCYWQSGFSSHIKMIILWSSSSLVVGSVLPWGPWEHSLAPTMGHLTSVSMCLCGNKGENLIGICLWVIADRSISEGHLISLVCVHLFIFI